MDFAKILDYARKRLEFDWLDFKATFDMDSEKHRAELVKDVSALANTVDTEGYLIIGVDCSGEALNLPGFGVDLDDAKLQQIVNSRLNRPVRFTYDLVEHEGKTYGRFTVPYSDIKPHQVTKDWGITEITKNGTEKQKIISQGQVFRREGSSTRPATAEEIIEMSLNAVNDLSKIEEEDLANRVVILLRRGDHVGIREMLRNAPRPVHALLGYINSQIAPGRALMDNIGRLDQLIIDHSRRIATIGFAIIRHHCMECYEDLLRCLSQFYLFGNGIEPLRIRESARQTWQVILILGGFSMAIRNWDFMINLLRHRTWTQKKEREYLFLHFLNPEKGGVFHPSFERLYYSPAFIEQFDCDRDQYMIHLSEFDLLAYIYSKRIKGAYLPSWQSFLGPWQGRLLEEVVDNTAMREFLHVQPGSIGISDLKNIAS